VGLCLPPAKRAFLAGFCPPARFFLTHLALTLKIARLGVSPWAGDHWIARPRRCERWKLRWVSPVGYSVEHVFGGRHHDAVAPAGIFVDVVLLPVCDVRRVALADDTTPAASPDTAATPVPPAVPTVVPATGEPAAAPTMNDLVDDFWHYGTIGRYDLAADAGEKIVAMNADPRVVLEAFETVASKKGRSSTSVCSPGNLCRFPPIQPMPRRSGGCATWRRSWAT